MSLAAIALAAGCGAGGGRRTVAGGCGATTLHRGPAPSWTAHSDAPKGIPYATAAHGTAAGFVFGYPLRAGHPSKPANKILWILRRPGTGLAIHAAPLHASRPVVKVTVPDSSGPEIYPSYVDAPSAGCWHLELRWAGHSDSLDLAYRG